MHVTAFVPKLYSSRTATRSLEALRRTGTTHAVVVPHLFMAAPTASSVAPSATATASDDDLLRVAATARSLGMRVVVKPHIEVADGSFRGRIAPVSPQTWFASYTTIIERYAELAERMGAETLVVGTELSSMSGYEQAWRDVIAAARARFSGRLTFAANWIAGARLVGFWDALDYIGVDAYMPLAAGQDPNPPVQQLVTAWEPYVRQLDELRRAYRRPVLFTELGYQSRLGTARRPAEVGGSGQVSQSAQARAYEAAFRVWSKVGWFRGIWWWEWSAEGLNERVGDGSFRPAGKQAENVLRRFNGRPPLDVVVP